MTEGFWTPQLVSALAGFSGVGLGTLIAWLSLGKRIEADERLAERRFEFDKDLAERKFRYDRGLHDHKRKVELAETLLAQFLQARDIFTEIRSPFASSDEAGDRPRGENESDGQREQLDSYYVPLARIRKNSEFISSLMSKRYQARAVFGQSADNAFLELREVIIRIQVSANTILNMIRRGPIARERNEALWEKCEDDLWESYGKQDELKERVNAAIETIENLCRPILESADPL